MPRLVLYPGSLLDIETDVIVNAADAGNGFPWHFDTNNFTVTLALQNADGGGEFEYAPMIRDSDHENFDEAALVIDSLEALDEATLQSLFRV